ncbi:MAG: FtsX-like permease family protein, partial [Flavitalea sp.]
IRPTVLINTSVLEGFSDFRGNVNWYNTFASNYLRLRKGSDSKTLEAKIANIVKLNYPKDHAGNAVIAVPFKNIANENSSFTGVIIKGAAGAAIFVLLIVLVNLINLNTAGMYMRTKEVAIKQMMGGSKKSIVLQFCIENGIIVLISILFAWFIFSLLLLPTINDLIKDTFGAIETDLKKDYPIILLFMGIGILFTILAASLPAVKLTAVKVTDAVKGKIVSGNYKNSLVRNTFITVQFVLAITLICVTIILNRQIKYMKSSSLGFDQEDVAVVSLNLAFRDQPSANARFMTIVNELKNNPHVQSVSVNGVIPTAYWDNFNTYFDPVTNKEINLRQADADAGYLKTFKILLVEGKYFNDDLGSMQKSSAYINRTAMNLLGWKTAVGKQIKSKGDQPTTYTIVGVMEDFHYRDLSGSIEPIIQGCGGKPSLEKNYLSVRTDAGYMVPIMKKLEAAFKTMPSRRAFSYEQMNNKVDKQYELFDGILKATNAIALLTILIASLGMFGLIALFAKLRVKEIGIRKVLGASVTSILQLLSKDFLVLVGVAILIATPVAWYLMNTWLKDFAYRINISWWMFAAAGLIAICIAFFTISFQAIKSAIANPVKSLRTE